MVEKKQTPNAISGFAKGMIQDMAKTSQPKDSYFKAKNARIVTDAGQSTMALANTQGTNLDFYFPRVSSLWEITPGSGTPTGAWSTTVTVSTTSGPTTVSISGTIGGYEEFFAALFAAFASGTTPYDREIRIVRGGANSALIYMLYGSVIGVSVNNSVYGTSTKILNGAQDLIPIASCEMRDDIIVITREETPTDVQDIDGQIWRVSYDENDAQSSTLLYYGALSLSEDYPIKRMLGNYENTEVQRIYWTDDHNPLRSLNVANEDAAGIPVEQLNIIPGVSQERARITEVLGAGALKAGMYQVGYRLIREGAASTYSSLSNQIHIVEESEISGLYIGNPTQYEGTEPETDTTKSLKLVIDTLETKYDTIEFVIFRHYNTSTTGFSWGPFPVPNSGSIEKVFTGNESVSSITVEEYNLLSGIDTVGDLAVINNNLIGAKIGGSLYNDIQFDCRAYRHNALASGADSYMDLALPNWATYSIFDDDAPTVLKNAVNPWNIDVNAYADDDDRFMYKSDGSTAGGTGLNVSYEVVMHELDGDEAGTVGQLPAEWLKKARATSTVTTDKAYENVGTWYDYKSPYIHSLLTGYARGETYRFGAVIRDLKGRPSFVQWVGDIRFPDITDVDTLKTYRKDGTTFSTVPTTAVHESLSHLLTLGIEFTFDVSDIKDEISGIEIVRVKREETDRTRLGMGAMFPMREKGLWTAQGVEEASWYLFDNDLTATFGSRYNTFDCPDIMYGRSITHDAEDLILMGAYTGDVAESYETTNGSGVHTGDADGNDFPDDKSMIVTRYEEISQGTPLMKSVVQLEPLAIGGKVTTWDGADVANYAESSSAEVNEQMGRSTLFAAIDTANPTRLTVYGTNIGVYVRNLLVQYGGSDYISRSKNVYVACGCFIPVNSDSADSQTFICYGGDTYVTYFGYYKTVPNYAYNGSLVYPVRPWVEDKSIDWQDCRDGNYDAFSNGKIIPLECSYNHDLNIDTDIFRRSVNGYALSLSYYNMGECNYAVPAVYDRANEMTTYVPQPELYDLINSFDNRFVGSASKINGETIDSWRTLSTYKDVEGIHGPINWIERIGENVAFFQDKASGIMTISPRTAVQTADSGQPLELAVGSLLHDFEYLSTEYGSIHRPAKTPNSIYFFDKYSRKYFKLGSEKGTIQLSDIKGLNSFFYKNTSGIFLTMDNPWKDAGMSWIYDPRFNELLITIRNADPLATVPYDRSFTISFSEFTDTFVSLHTFTPPIYMTNSHIILSPFGTEIHQHNIGPYGYYYDGYYDWELDVVVNPMPTETKVFDTIAMHSEVSIDDDGVIKDQEQPMSSLRLYTDTQNTDWFTPTTGAILDRNCYRAEREWRYSIPGSQVVNHRNGIFEPTNLDPALTFKERPRDKYMTANMKFTNINNMRMMLHYVRSWFRLSAR